MNAINDLKFFLLRSADAPQEIPIKISDLAFKFHLQPSDVRDVLIGLYEKGYITLSAWDGNCRKPFKEWPNADAFFSSIQQGGDKWIKVRSRSKQSLNDKVEVGGRPKPKIEFI